MTRAGGREAGFTLIEMLISLALFALIALAGIALVETILGVQAKTSTRLQRFGDIQRAMFVLQNDLGQIGGGPVEGDATAIHFTRPLASASGQPQPISYGLAGGVVRRSVGQVGVQPLLDGVSAVRWRYFVVGDGWHDRWPPDPTRKDERPSAIEIQIGLAPAVDRPAGSLRRLVAVPARP